MDGSATNIFMLAVIKIFGLICSVNGNTLESLISKGTNALVSGQLNEALHFYSDAVGVAPNSYLAAYHRATVYIAMGKLKAALPDLEKAVSLNQDYLPAYKQKININIKMGTFEKARSSLLLLQFKYPEYLQQLNKIEELESLIKNAKELYNTAQYADTIPILDNIISTVTLNSDLHEMRAICFLKIGEKIKGIEYLRTSVHMKSDNRAGILRVSELMYDYGLALRSLEEIRGCLQLDQDDSACRIHYSKVKKMAKFIVNAETSSENDKWKDCVLAAKNILKMEKNNMEYLLQANIHLCHCGARENAAEAIAPCDFVIERLPNSVDYHFDKAEAFINLDQLDKAETEFRKIFDKEANNKRAREGVERVQRMRKMASKRDYYKILNVPRSATTDQIKSAYRKLAGKNHPDKFNFKNEAEKKKAEARFLDINDARDVLVDKEMRSMFDQGMDPKDPEHQSGNSHGGHGSPFNFQGFNPFEGGNFEFHFG